MIHCCLYFSIIKKEERADGTGTELVPDVISVSPKEDDEAKSKLSSLE